MSTHDPAPVALSIAIITVSTSRSAPGGAGVDDRSGAVIAELCVGAGHTISSRTLVPDDPTAIDAALVAALGGEAQVVILTGGTGVSARDCTPAVVRQRLDRDLPGFAELFRMLSWQQVGSKAMLSSALGGVAVGRAVFSLPGSPRACALAMEKLILPEVGHILGELAKEAPAAPSLAAPSAPAAPSPAAAPLAGPPSARSSVVSRPAARPEARPRGETLEPASPVQGTSVPTGIALTVAQDAVREDSSPIASGWEAGLRALFGVVERRQPEIPESLSRMQAVVDVLNSAGTRATVRLQDGAVYGAWGFPDLSRRGSKVLLVREAEPVAEIVALHRWPSPAGVCCEGGGVLPDATLALASFTEDRTGRAYEGAGGLFAVDGNVVWILLGRKLIRWDGRKTEAAALAAAEPVSSALATMVLGWSGR
ncbi:MAG: molybdenum cofactor biosynthesis protein MoaB [Myxococcales bacterium]|nr:molybdenum cofactor biosynthesis protein MoaB [Myxococcales bacterium]